MKIRSLALVGLLLLQVECSPAAESPSPETDSLRSPLAVSPPSLGPDVASMELKLVTATTGSLSLKLADTLGLSEDEVQRHAFNLSFQGTMGCIPGKDCRPVSVPFNDNGQPPDMRAGDGIFSGTIDVNLTALDQLNRELLTRKDASRTVFNPRARTVSLNEGPISIDTAALRAGKSVPLPNLGKVAAVAALGGNTTPVDWQKSLLIIALPVTQDPTRTMNPCANTSLNSTLKPWTFGYLMKEMSLASGLPSPSAFVEQWVKTWTVQQDTFATSGAPLLDSVGTDAATNTNVLILNPWKARSGGPAAPLDLSIAPFRLNAILYRPDLGTSSPYSGGGNSAGELRFVFGLMNVKDNNNDGDALDPGDVCQPTEMAVIFEYGIPIQDCLGIKNWANEFVSLSALLPGTAAYNSKLQALTDQVVKSGAAPTKPNQSALNQLRTNEISLSNAWQLREFHLHSPMGKLEQATTKNNPREHQFGAGVVLGTTPAPEDLNGSSLLLADIQANVPLIQLNKYTLPELVSGQPYLGNSSTYNLGIFWDHPALSSPTDLLVRHKYAMLTCSGCHTEETGTVFYHIRPMGTGQVPILSSFLTTSPFNPPDPKTHQPHAQPFKEMDNRIQALNSFANSSCLKGTGLIPFQVMSQQLQSVH